ncbi:WD40 repeat domain-containing serine/threonine protein kinase [Streptomyces shenzhenensis]|uniref:WD40 repeat domain-containing serine/threonine protein kinase n=1 Tax=Streptomyces shenzhenensis TaxID=943815 RepID=UPI003D8CFF2A
MAMGSWRRGDVVLGLYEVLDVSDGGGMGLVYRVRHRDWNTDLAVKVPRPELVAGAAGRSGFETEAGTWVSLALHPHVVGCAYVRRIEDVPCVFAEWIEGGSLAELVRDGRLYADTGPDPSGALARVLDLAVQMAWGIDHAHRQGLIHQDVKPANVMVETGAVWTAKVTDFGLAGARAAAGERSAVPAESNLLASYGGMTPAYCSPEQADARAGARISLTRATDVWSWALSVLEMFVGSPPCRYGQSAPEVFAAYLESGPPGPPGAPALPPALAGLLGRCFASDPARRPHRLDELAAAVIELYEEAIGVPYPRVPPQEAQLLAAGLSNQALSLLDLDRAEEAEELWRTAKDVDPHHLPTVYNWALHRWRQGSLSDEDIVSDLRTTRALYGEPAEVDRLLALVQVERGDAAAAEALLADAPDAPEVSAARAELARREPTRPPELLEGHRGAVTSAALSADASVALTGGEDGRVRVWDPAAHRCRCVLPRERTGAPPSGDGTAAEDEELAPVTAVALTPDGRTALVGRRTGPAELWDLTTGGLLRVLGERRSAATAVALNGSGGAVVAHEGGPIEVWDLGTGQLVRALDHPPSTFRRLDPATGRILPEIHRRPSAVSAVALAEDGRVAVSASKEDGSVVSWDVATGGPLYRLVKSADMHGTGIDLVALAPYGTYALLTGHLTDKVRIWETRTDRVRDVVPRRFAGDSLMALNREATRAASVASGHADQPLRIWETRTGRCVRTIDTQLLIEPHTRLTLPLRIHSVALSADGRLVVLGDGFGGVQFHRLAPAGFRAPWSYARPRTAGALAEGAARVRGLVERAEELAGQGRTRAAAEQLRTARAVPGFERHPELRALWADLGRSAGRRTDLLSIWQRYDLSGGRIFTQQVNIGVSTDAELAVTGGSDGRVRVWELQTGQHLHTFPERVANTHTVLIAADCRLAVTADWGGEAHLWDVEEGTRSARLHGDQGQVRSVAIDRNGDHALVGDEGGAVCLWRLRAGARDRTTVVAHLGRTMLGHDGPVGVVRLSPDGRFAASAGREDRTGRLWATGTGVPLLTFPLGVGDPGMWFAPDGRRFFVNSTAGLTVWDVRTRRPVYERQAHPGALVLSADGRMAVTPGLMTVEVWETATGRTVCELPEFSSTFDISPDGHYVVTADRDRRLRMWDVRTGRCLHTLEGHPESVTLVAFTVDGRNVVSADLRPGIRLWELDYDYDFAADGRAEAGDR